MELYTCRELKNKSRIDLNGKWTLGAVISFVAVLFVTGATFFYTFCSISRIAALSGLLLYYAVVFVLTYGLYIVFYNMVRHNKQPDIDDLFVAIRSGRAFVTTVIMHLFIGLWTLLLIVPGVIMSLAYSMAPFIVEDDPSCYGLDALGRSRAMMRGHKWSYFKLSLSFIGWMFLSIITLGVGLIWLIPYMQTTFANFYINLRDSQNQLPTE